MTDFLQFLNSADLNTLTKVSGITRPIATGIIAARPFDRVEECLKVRGMGKGLLARLQSFAEAQVGELENKALVPVQDGALSIPVEQSQPVQENIQEGPSFWSRLGAAFVSFLRALIRLIIIAAFIAGIGALLYYGLPYINRTFIAPVEKNTAQIDKLEADIAALQTQLDETNNRVTALETSVETHTASLEKLNEMQSTLETQLKDNNDKTLLKLKQEVKMTRALDMLGRARLYLAQSNFGMAKEDVQSAHDLLSELQNETNDEALKQVVARLDLALGNLPDFPVVAAGDLEIAWQILMTGAPVNVLAETPTPASLPTSTTEAIVTSTPTPLDVPTATSIP